MYYRLTVCQDTADRRRFYFVVHWDDNDPNTMITQVAEAGPITNEAIADAALSMGFSVVSHDSDNAARGWAVVTRNGSHPWFDPVARAWFATRPQTQP